VIGARDDGWGMLRGMKRIAFDMDDVLADTLGAQLAWFRARHGYRWTRGDLVGKRIFEDLATAPQVAEHDEVLHEGSFFGDLPVMPGAVEVVRELARRHEVYVASAATEFPRSCAPKLEWLGRHFPFLPASRVVFCGDKGILDADVLVDDGVHHLRRFRGQGIVFDAPHNVGEAGFPRVKSWDDLARLLL
jgi:5'(3')-deoxyribonucleotidase